MTPQQYCQAHAAPTGSTLYSALYFEAAPMRQALLPVYALDQVISEIPLNCHEPEVAIKTLDWWRDEIAAAYKGQATHPATLALQQTLQTHSLAQEYFEEQLDAQRQLVINQHLTDRQELALYFHRSGGALWLMAAEVCGYEERQSHRIVIKLGTALRELSTLARLRVSIDHDFLLLPEDLMKQHKVSISDLQQVATTSHVQNLIQDMAKCLREDIENNLASLPVQDRWSLRHLIIQAELGLALLTAIEEIDYKLIEQTIYITPLQTLWIAWRVKRQEKKNMKQVLL